VKITAESHRDFSENLRGNILLIIFPVYSIHEAQVLTYLKLGNYPLGYLINFNVLQLIKGLKRYINKVKPL